MNQHEALVEKRAKTATTDRRYRGKSRVGETINRTPKPFNDKKLSKYQQKKERKSFKRRTGIEPTIGHVKTDHRLGRNFYKGIFGDNINIMLAAAAFNFKRMMNKWKSVLFGFFRQWFLFFQICMKLKCNSNIIQISTF
ncbi:transposase [Pedobacter sp. MW01-1-1]|uniref:transposase n=1 Tax=Pedobacter sp. MW01-1-1 TaxID=3383027 RepID=UPI003FF0ECD2